MHICDRMMYIHTNFIKYAHIILMHMHCIYLTPLRTPAGTRAAVPAPAVPFGLQVAGLRAVGGGSYLPPNCFEKIYHICVFMFFQCFF